MTWGSARYGSRANSADGWLKNEYLSSRQRLGRILQQFEALVVLVHW